MLRRFSLYGFLKNQRYYEPFLILVFLDKGLSFFAIGLLIAFREITINLFEIPSGAVADVWGRRRAMILSFVAYILSFAIFGLSTNLPLLFVAMFFFAVGEAFRTGTHKAMIFSWLRAQGREGERTKIYGYTRSWSQFGSALSVLLAALVVLASDSYTYVFYLSIAPYLLGILNFLHYPAELDGRREGDSSLRSVAAHLWESIALSFRRRRIRRLVLESAGFEGAFKASKDYLQPVLKSAALAVTAGWALTAGLEDVQKTALLVGPAYFLLHFLSGLASRHAHLAVRTCGSEEGAARWIWGIDLLVFAGLLGAMVFEVHAAMIGGFLLLSVLQNFWRPVLISRFDAQGCEARAATVLSIESQAKSVSTMIIAPLLGLAVDFVRERDLGGAFWPVGALGVAVALLFLVTGRRKAGRKG